MAHDARKAELIAALDRARSRLAANAHALRDDLDPLARARRSFQRNGFAWVGGATLLGVLLARLPARTKTVTVDRRGRKVEDTRKAATAGLTLGVLKIAFDLAKPWLAGWISRRAASFADGDVRSSSRARESSADI
jgi:hypothetical protein